MQSYAFRYLFSMKAVLNFDSHVEPPRKTVTQYKAPELNKDFKLYELERSKNSLKIFYHISVLLLSFEFDVSSSNIKTKIS